MNTQHYAIARMAKTMAVQTRISLDPTKITPRIKNKTIKWLQQGHLEGGWASEARKIGQMLVNKYNLAVSGNTYSGVTLFITNDAMRDRALALLDADWAAALLERSSYKGSWYERRYSRARADLVNYCREVNIIFHDDAFRSQAIKLIGENMSVDDKAHIQRAVDALRGTEPIHITTFG